MSARVSVSPRRWRTAGLSLLAAAGLAAAGCGVDEDQAPQADQSAPAEAGSVFPVEVEHKYGTTTITAEPKKVVTLGLSDHDTALALGVTPIGAIDWFKERPYGIWPWTDELWGSDRPQIVGERDNFNKEKILELDPDLVIAVYSGMSEQQYEDLSDFTDVVAQPKDFPDYGAPWQDMTRQIGTALGKAEETEKLIDDIDARFAAVRDEHPEWADQQAAVVDPWKPGVYGAFAESDPKAVFLTEMGFTIPDKITEAAEDGNAVDLSSERLDLVDVDRLVFLTDDGKQRVEDDPVYQGLDVAREDRALFVPYSDPPIGAAMSFNTVLSIPYAIDQLVPLLEQ